MGSKRGKNFSGADFKLVTLGYLHVGQDPVLGNGQRGNCFWKRVAEYFNEHRAKDTESRSDKSIEGKWVQIWKDTTKFAGVFQAVVSLDESGTSFDQQVEKALALYKCKHPKLEDFAFLDCWLILRHVPRWAELPSLARKCTPLADSTNATNNVGPGQAMGANSPNGPGSGGSQSSGNLDPVEEPSANGTPQGNKKAKENIKRQRILDDSLIKQAEAASQLTATILEKVQLMKEQSVVTSFALKDENGKILEEGKEFFRLKRARDLARFKRDIEEEERLLGPLHQQEPVMHSPELSMPPGSGQRIPSDGLERDLPTASRTNLFGDDSQIHSPEDSGEESHEGHGEQSPGYNTPSSSSWNRV